MAVVLKTKQHDLGGLTVKRFLPNPEYKMVGPFIFFDHFGPAQFEGGQGVNVRPHPHIGLSTLTYLFEGSLLHRDSLGNQSEILPGDVNWMTAGKGIVHSERESLEVRANPHSLNGLQSWVALPRQYTEIEPAFSHVKKENLPIYLFEDVMARIVVGEAYGYSAPVKTYSAMFYVDVVAGVGSQVYRPNLDLIHQQDTAVYIINGEVSIREQSFEAGDFILLEADDHAIDFITNGRVVILGGDKFSQAPLIEWNFVSFDKDLIEQAKEDWKAGRFPDIPGDDKEFIPLD